MAKVTRTGREKAKRRLLEVMRRKALPTAQRLAPVDTGMLRDSLQVTMDEGAPYLFSDKNYAPNVEFGTEKNSPQPFIRPAIRRLND